MIALHRDSRRIFNINVRYNRCRRISALLLQFPALEFPFPTHAESLPENKRIYVQKLHTLRAGQTSLMDFQLCMNLKQFYKCMESLIESSTGSTRRRDLKKSDGISIEN
jgi:hypothetical protein